MVKYLNRDLADLAHQLSLSPKRLRIEQFMGIEKVLTLVEPERTYPFEWVCFHITGYQRRSKSPGCLIPGRVVIGDIVMMAEDLSRRDNIAVEELSEPYLTHEGVAGELKVSTKTLRRWRTRGLLGFRAVCSDGMRRLVFLRRSIDRFVRQNRALVERGAAFRQLSGVERDRIVSRAREIVAQTPAKLHTVARIIGEETGRAVETIRYTLRRYDDTSDTPLFVNMGHSAGCQRYAAIWSCHEAGERIDAIARAFDCSVEEIQRVLAAVQVRTWQANPLDCVYNELFDAPDADALILDVGEPAGVTKPLPSPPEDLPAYLQSLYRIPLLTREQEQDLFRRYNYMKYRAQRVIEKLDPESVTTDEVAAARNRIAEIDEIRQRIVRSNLRLVVSITKKHVGWTPAFFEVISDGNMSLLRAVEKFDYAMGNKFSTYASWAVMKNYARSIPEEHYRHRRYVTGQDEWLDAAPDESPEPICVHDVEHVHKTLASALDELDDREREIVTDHFALFGRKQPVTLEQLGRRFGVTKERIRQIERRALDRIREFVGPALSDALTH